MAFNACIRRQVLLDRDGKPYNCRRYYEANTWIHPDTGATFVWHNRVRPMLFLPDNVYAVRDTYVVSR